MRFNNKIFVKRIAIVIFAMANCFYINAQCLTGAQALEKLNAIKEIESNSVKLEQGKRLLKVFTDCNPQKDSVYVRLLDRLGLFEYLNGNYDAALEYAKKAIIVSRSVQKNSSLFLSALYRNIAYYSEYFLHYTDALNYFDTSIIVAEKTSINAANILDSRHKRCLLLFQIGDYQNIVQESSMAIYEAVRFDRKTYLPFFYNQRAQAHNYQNELKETNRDADSAFFFAKQLSDTFEQASSLKIKAIVASGQYQLQTSDSLFRSCIFLRSAGGDKQQLALDYIDYGNMLLLGNAKRAIEAYKVAQKISLLEKDSILQAKALTNIGNAYFNIASFSSAAAFYQKALNAISIKGNFQTLKPLELNRFVNKELLIFLFKNETETLLAQFKKTGKKNYLKSALKLALVTDTVISQSRKEQVGEKSKLYWRSITRDLYSNALEICFQLSEPVTAFYFMERSRAVLLNDKLKELSASAFINRYDYEKEEKLQFDVLNAQRRMEGTLEGTKEYYIAYSDFVSAKNSSDHFIKELEARYPSYYQYKYSDKVITQAQLDRAIEKNKQQILQYFVTDSFIYTLAIAKGKYALDKFRINYDQVSNILAFSASLSNLNYQNVNYLSFEKAAIFFSKIFLKHLDPSLKRIVVCPDNVLFPFEALLFREKPVKYIIEDYSLSYVYSASFLANKIDVHGSFADFVGFAPASFSNFRNLPDLIGSAKSIERAGASFGRIQLFTESIATRQNLINNLGNYSVVNIFSHAMADTAGNGPVLFMYDSSIRLNEIEVLRNRSSQIVILNACETSAGKAYTGEGVYSFARGFASLGVPSVAATLWKADEAAIYEISEQFNKNLANGSNKDDALRQAKLAYLSNHKGLQSLPFYWANMILIGDAGPVILSPHKSVFSTISLLIIVGVTIIIICFLLLLRRNWLKSASNKN